MAASAVSSVIQYLGSLLAHKVELLKGVHKEIATIKSELEYIQCFLKDAESKAETGKEGAKIWVKEVRGIAYQIEDIIDEYVLLHLAKQQPRRFSFIIRYFRKVTHSITRLKQRHEIASQIQDIKTTIGEIKERADRYKFSTTDSEQSSSTKDDNWHDPRLASLYLEKDEVFGIEYATDKLIKKLLEEQSQREVISVVGMAGVGKTTLAKKVYDSQQVDAHFDCKAWFSISQSYKPDGLLKTMIKKLSEKEVPLDKGIDSMDQKSLIDKLREYLKEKRYVIVFDDVWEIDFWEFIRCALPENRKGSRVIITTRKEHVAPPSVEPSMKNVHKLEPLSQEEAWKLFCAKAFRGHCPSELKEVSHEIVRKCEGLPLAIVAIGALLSRKQKFISEWQKFCDSLGSELGRNLTSIKKIVLFSYNDLPHYLKSCFLYFGIIPEDYSISCGRLIRLWIAEGLVEERKGNTLEEVAEEYLTELIDRCLVQVSTTKFDGRVGECRVHDVVREIILSMLEEFSFSQLMEEENSSFNDTTRRLSMHMHYCSMDKVMESIIKSPVRSVFLFQVGELPKKPLLGTLAENFKLLKTVDVQDAPLDQLHEKVGNLFLLRYLSIRNTRVETIPKSIGKLQNLQTLDLKYSFVRELPFDIGGLPKLRHLLACFFNSEAEHMVDFIVGVKIQGGIGGLEELQSLWYVETNDGLIKDLEKLRQLRKLGITKLEREHGRALCAAIEKMKYLQRLRVSASSDDEILDLQYISSSPPHYLQRLHLAGRLEKLPDWIPKLQNLVGFSLVGSGLTKNDPLKALQVLSSLARLVLWDAYDWEQLYFEVGRFQKLKELRLLGLKGLNSVIIEEGALPLLEDLTIEPSPQLKEVPSSIHRLKNLKTLQFVGMPEEFIDRMEPKPNQGKDYWIVKHIPRVELWSRIRKQGGIPKIDSLEEYFNRKVENARVREDKNESHRWFGFPSFYD